MKNTINYTNSCFVFNAEVFDLGVLQLHILVPHKKNNNHVNFTNSSWLVRVLRTVALNEPEAYLVLGTHQVIL